MPLKSGCVGFRKLNRNLHHQRLWLQNKMCQAARSQTFESPKFLRSAPLMLEKRKILKEISPFKGEQGGSEV